MVVVVVFILHSLGRGEEAHLFVSWIFTLSLPQSDVVRLSPSLICVCGETRGSGIGILLRKMHHVICLLGLSYRAYQLWSLHHPFLANL